MSIINKSQGKEWLGSDKYGRRIVRLKCDQRWLERIGRGWFVWYLKLAIGAKNAKVLYAAGLALRRVAGKWKTRERKE